MNDQALFNQLIQKTSFSPQVKTCISNFVLMLSNKGYVQYTVYKKIKVISRLGKWIKEKRLSIKDLNEENAERFICHLKKRNFLQLGNQATIKQLIDFLRKENIIATPSIKPADSEIEIILKSFLEYLKFERGLSRSTIDKHLSAIRLFLTDRFGKKDIFLDKLCPKDIPGFILRHAHTLSISSAQSMVGALRIFFSLLYQRGQININLAAAVPSATQWRPESAPKFLKPEQVRCILDTCDRKTPMGQRNYAILLLLARLGLRAGEIANMELEDIFWESGEIMIKGKSKRQQKLPLPDDVGKAIAAYIRYSRPRCSSRKVFIRMKAPIQGFTGSVNVCTIVRQSLKNAGIKKDFKGSHLFRYTLATNMLGGGADIKEIGQILGHQSPTTTEKYTKVDIGALRKIAQPWPGGRL